MALEKELELYKRKLPELLPNCVPKKIDAWNQDTETRD